MRNFPKLLKTIFLIIFIFQMIGLIFLLLTPNITNATDPVGSVTTFTPQVSIPGSDSDGKTGFIAGKNHPIDKTTAPIAEYITAIYNYAIAIVGIIAAGVLVFAGIKWTLAGGSPEKLTDAKAWIGAALTGLVLVMTSYMLLNIINPRLTNFQILSVQKPVINNQSEITDKLGNWYFHIYFKVGDDSANCYQYGGNTKINCDNIKNSYINNLSNEPTVTNLVIKECEQFIITDGLDICESELSLSQNEVIIEN